MTDTQLESVLNNYDSMKRYADSYHRAYSEVAEILMGADLRSPAVDLIIATAAGTLLSAYSHQQWSDWAVIGRDWAQDTKEHRDELSPDVLKNGDPEDDSSAPYHPCDGDQRHDPGSAGDDAANGDLPGSGPFLSPPPSPLVFDLDGDGVELTALSASTAQFDLNADGFAECTGWVGADDGILVLDRNANGYVDGGLEVFGNAAGHAEGFAYLAELDTNGDGVITNSDASFSALQIWRDLDGDGTIPA